MGGESDGGGLRSADDTESARVGPQRALEWLLDQHLGVAMDAPGFRADPYPAYDALRSISPVLRVPEMGEVLVTGYDEALAVLRDPRFSTNAAHRRWPGGTPPPEVAGAPPLRGANVLLFIDPPDHTRIRRLVSAAFTPRTVERLRSRVAEMVADIGDRAADEGGLDVIADLGFTVPVTVICELMGVPTEDQHLFGPWSSDVSRILDGFSLTPDEVNAAAVAAAQMVGYFTDLFARRRAEPADDLVSALLAVESEGERLSEVELFSTTLLLFIAGHETTTNLIGNGVWALLRNRDQLVALHRDPGLAPSAVEELLRFDSPVHVTARIPTVDVEVAGHQFAAGEQLIVLLSAANRDPRRFADPDRLDVTRADNHHLAFSQGMHFCLGAALARLEGAEAIGGLVARFGDSIEVVSDPVTYRDHFVLRGLQELRVSV
jgi:cytochrome P450